MSENIPATPQGGFPELSADGADDWDEGFQFQSPRGGVVYGADFMDFRYTEDIGLAVFAENRRVSRALGKIIPDLEFGAPESSGNGLRRP